MNKTLLFNLGGKIYSYGLYIPVSNIVLNKAGNRLPEAWANRIFETRYRKITDRLKKIAGPIEIEAKPADLNDGPVWSIWLQGEDSMPAVVKLCIDSIRRNIDDRPVNIITFKNMHNYLDLGGRIMDLHKAGRIDHIHFADLIRMRLIADHGGMWADGTIFLSQNLDPDWFKLPFYSIKNPLSGRFVSRNRWTGFCFAGARGAATPKVVDTIFRRYWESQDWRMDYFLIDACINLAYETVPQVKAEIDAVPYNNPQLYAMRDLLCEPFDKEKYDRVTADTSIFKLNWRASNNPALTSPDSFFSHLKGMI